MFKTGSFHQHPVLTFCGLFYNTIIKNTCDRLISFVGINPAKGERGNHFFGVNKSFLYRGWSLVMLDDKALFRVTLRSEPVS